MPYLKMRKSGEAKTAINEYMDFYNRQRMHQTLDYKTPECVYFEKNIV
ncbi:MAG: IS3 family transposase [Rickettsia endosymbiont of Haemaphysalis japonica]